MILNKTYVLMAALLASEAWSQSYGDCRRDYSRPCAQGWTRLINEEECVAPLSYVGPCHRMLQIEYNSRGKTLQEENCNIRWPCLVECEKDYTSVCPEDWINDEGTLCRPLSTYAGFCLNARDFSDMSEAQKEIWSNKCESTWPCKNKCKPDYAKTCPENWTRDEKGLCTAPKNYSGPCLPKASLFSLDHPMKVAFGELCKVQFPCVRSCEIDERVVCPKRWVPEFNGSEKSVRCHPPSGYRGPCDKSTSFNEDKQEKAVECAVDWTCVEDTLRRTDYERVCPDGWNEYEQVCMAPQSYNGPCKKKKQMRTYTKRTKIEYEYECHVQWPLNVSAEAQKSTGLRKGRNQYGAVEPDTGHIVSII